MMKTDWKEDKLSLAMGGKRKYQIYENADGTVSFNDATEYDQVGDEFGASQLNEIGTEMNTMHSETQSAMEVARMSANSARESAERAMSATPEGYEQLVETVDSQNVHFATGKEINVPTKKGGIRIDEVKGSAHKSANLLKPTLGTQALNGVTLTNNGDGTYTVNGTATAYCSFRLKIGLGLTDGVTYKLIGAPSGSNNTKRIMIYNRTDGTIPTFDVGNGGTFVNDASKLFEVIIEMHKDSSFSNALFKPMITTDLSATYDDYEPYGVHTAGGLGYVDLAELSWVKEANVFFTNLTTKGFKVKGKVISNGYATSELQYSAIQNKSVSSNTNGFGNVAGIIVKDDSYNDVASFVAHLKADKVQLAYELADRATPSQYAEVIKEHGKNEINETLLSSEYYSVNANGVNILKSDGRGWNSLVNFKLKPRTIYTLSVSAENVRLYCGRDGVYSANSDGYDMMINGKKLTFKTSESGITCFKLLPQNGSYPCQVGHIMLEEGTEATAYTPYESKTVIIPLKYPLAKIGDIANYIDETGKHYPIHKVIFDGSEDWTLVNGVNDKGFIRVRTTKKLALSTTNVALVNRHSNITVGNSITSSTTGYTALDIRSDMTILNVLSSVFDNCTDANGFKNSLSNNPLEIYYYVTSEITTEPLDESFYELESYEGKTYIDTADEIAKPIISVGYGKSDVVATALLADNKASAEKINRKIEESEIKSKLKIKTEIINGTTSASGNLTLFIKNNNPNRIVISAYVSTSVIPLIYDNGTNIIAHCVPFDNFGSIVANQQVTVLYRYIDL